jgi:hypothetical protein
VAAARSALGEPAEANADRRQAGPPAMPAGGTLAELQAEVVELTGDHAVFTGRWEQIAQAQDHRRPISPHPRPATTQEILDTFSSKRGLVESLKAP